MWWWQGSGNKNESGEKSGKTEDGESPEKNPAERFVKTLELVVRQRSVLVSCFQRSSFFMRDNVDYTECRV